jgi:hypothetical protein
VLDSKYLASQEAAKKAEEAAEREAELDGLDDDPAGGDQLDSTLPGASADGAAPAADGTEVGAAVADEPQAPRANQQSRLLHAWVLLLPGKREVGARICWNRRLAPKGACLCSSTCLSTAPVTAQGS